MKIGLAQIRPVKGNIPANTHKHEQLISLAVRHQADALFFPELSLTSYEPELAHALALAPDAGVLTVFESLAHAHRLMLGIGAPLRTPKGIQIALFVFRPDTSREIYAKQMLHTDELPYFVQGHTQLILQHNALNIAPAICYESLQENHAAHAHALGANIYLASVAKSQKGINTAFAHYPRIARQYNMPVLMANSTGPCDNFESAGQSAVWSNTGELLAQLDHTQEGILIFDTTTHQCVKARVN
ncbi:carbon-nitrogen hydrolase family protein [Emticicia sp. 17c]|uniref:carbon-nitrogen hydrolase family protein n=1 Tax=Emticicia sp. 17c TaxID=3127704 RepID=UPI00301C7763